MSLISLVLTALIGVEAVPVVLGWLRVARGAVTVAKVGKAVAPHVLEGFKEFTNRPDLSPNELALAEHVKKQRVVNLGGPMDKFA